MTDQVLDPSRRRPFWHLIVGFAVIVSALGFIGGWPLPFVIFAIIAMIVFHELGHFLTARLTGMKASEFFVGFGPRLWSRKKGETEYGVKAIMLGGYVKIIGMSSLEEVDPADEAKTFRVSTYPRKVLVASAGSLMHLLLAVILLWASLTFFGTEVAQKVKIENFSSYVGIKEMPAKLAGLKSGDVVERIGHRRINSVDLFSHLINESSGRTLSIVVLRHDHLVTLKVTPRDGRTLIPVGTTTPIAAPSGPAKGYIGVSIDSDAVLRRDNALAAVPGSIALTGHYIYLTAINVYDIFTYSGLHNIYHLVTNSKAAAQSATNPSERKATSIYGAGHLAYELAKVQPSALLGLFAAINIGIGMINMLPMLPLDGGHVAIATYERVRTRRGKARYVADVNKMLPFVYAFLAALILIFGSVLYLDIAHPIKF